MAEKDKVQKSARRGFGVAARPSLGQNKLA